MRPLRTLLFVAVAAWAGIPAWMGEPRLPLPAATASIAGARVALNPDDVARRRVGELTFMGGVRLTSPDPAFGGFSAIAVDGDGFTLVNDGGNVATFRMDSGGAITEPRFFPIPRGPGTGWPKMDRDSESLTVDHKTGRTWLGFEGANAIWRYAAGFERAERFANPPAMHDWASNGGIESLTRLRDGRFVAINEVDPGPGRTMLVFPRDPTIGGRPRRLRYMPPAGFDPSDVTQLPDGRLLVLNRRWQPPLRFRSALVVIDLKNLRAGATVTGREIARLGPPLVHRNFEGVAAQREGASTVVWLISDNDQYSWRPTLLLKFRLR